MVTLPPRLSYFASDDHVPSSQAADGNLRAVDVCCVSQELPIRRPSWGWPMGANLQFSRFHWNLLWQRK